MLPGALPAGDYHVTATGYQPSHDGVLRADVLVRSSASAERVLATVMSSGAADAAFGPDNLDATVSLPAVAAACGDTLVLRVKVVSGSSDYIEFATGMTIL